MKKNEKPFVLTKNAQASMLAIARYTQTRWGRDQRIIYMTGIDRKFTDLAKNPLVGKARGDIGEGVRSCVEGRHVIFYRPTAAMLIILDILHDSMDPNLHLFAPVIH